MTAKDALSLLWCFFKPTLWFWGFWISLAPHWAGKYLIPGSRAPPIAQGRKAVKFFLFSIRRIRIIYNFLVGFLLCFSNRSDNIRTHKKSNWKSSSKNRGKHSRKYLKPPPLIGTYIHTPEFLGSYFCGFKQGATPMVVFTILLMISALYEWAYTFLGKIAQPQYRMFEITYRITLLQTNMALENHECQ